MGSLYDKIKTQGTGDVRTTGDNSERCGIRRRGYGEVCSDKEKEEL